MSEETSRGDIEAAHGMGTHLAAYVARHARTDPDRVAVTFGDTDRTYAELDARAARLAGALAERGVTVGDRVAVLLPNRAEYVEAIVALSRLGAIAVLLNFRLTAPEIRHQLSDSGASAMLTDAGLDALAGTAAESTAVRFRLVAGPAYEQALAEAKPLPERRVDPAAPMLILYTSGTTGRPKGAVLTHEGFHLWATLRIAHMGYGRDCRTTLCAVPIFHVAGSASVFHTLLVGGRLVVHPSGAFDAGEIIDVLDRQRVNLSFFVPAQWQAIVRHPSIAGRDFPHLKWANWGAAPASAALVREIRAAFPAVALTSAFGMTETYATAMVLQPEHVEDKPASIGRPLLGVEVRVVDAQMRDVPAGEVGEIVYRGPTVTTGYWNAPEQTAEAFRGGWFHSGDLVRVDEDGFYYVVDRIKDMIISGGENVYCAEVENVLAAHPKVGSVAVVGAPDERWGEVPVAVVVPRDGEPPTAEELRSHGCARLASYKVPRRLLVVDALPMNSGGKVRKEVLRDLVRDTTAGSQR